MLPLDAAADCPMIEECKEETTRVKRQLGGKSKTVDLPESLDNLLDQMELDEVDRSLSSQDYDEDDYEEVDEFDPEYSVFGSEARLSQRSSESLGKRSRQSFEEEQSGDETDSLCQFEAPSKRFNSSGAPTALRVGKISSAPPLATLRRTHGQIFMQTSSKALYG